MPKYDWIIPGDPVAVTQTFMKTANGKYKAKNNWILTLTIWTICQPAKAQKADGEQMVSLAVFTGIGHLVINQNTYLRCYLI